MSNNIVMLGKVTPSAPAIYRKAGQRRLVVTLPARAHPGDGWLDYLPPRVHLPIHLGGNTWTIPVAHFEVTKDALVDTYGAVQIHWETASQAFCTASCRGGNRDRADRCNCTCEGTQHGVGHGNEVQVGDGLLIDTTRSARTWTEVDGLGVAA